MSSRLEDQSYTAGHFALQIDGHNSTAFLKSIEGGFIRGSTVEEPVGPTNERIKHTSTRDIDLFTIDFGLSGAKHLMQWIEKSWKKKPTRYNGQVTHANFNLQATFEHEFFGALITETTIPTLDGSSKEAAFLKVKIQPEKVVTRKIRSKQQVDGQMGVKQKLWLPSQFMFHLDGIDEMKYTNKIESFTIKQGCKKFYTGEDPFPHLEPTKIEFPHLTGTISLAHADKLLSWYDDYLRVGKQEPAVERTGAIEFLSPDHRQVIFQINLFDVGIHHLSILPSQANSDQIKRVKYELYVGRMELDPRGLKGFG